MKNENAEQPAPVQQGRMAWVYDTGRGYKIVGYDSAAIAHLDHGTLLVPNAPQPAQRKPLQIGDESAAFKEWFDAWWVGDGDICKSVTNEVEQTRSYKSQYTLAFGAWVAAKYAANNIKEQP